MVALVATSSKSHLDASGTQRHMAGQHPLRSFNAKSLWTGAAHGIGRALAQRFAREGVRHVAVADLDSDDDAAPVAVAVTGLTFAERRT